jgi:hypothetical protein
MALIDKIKAQAAVVAQKAQEAGKAGQSKIEDVQARRKADGLLRQLGAAFYAQRSGKAGDDNAAEIDRLVGELAAFESENGPLDATASAAAEPDAPAETETPPEGGFTL